jgi:serine/threonine-protein kinase
MAVLRDTVIDQRYRVIGRLGSGGMADVYCAEDLQLGRKVALKLLYERFAADGEFVERFRREASSAAGLQHPNVVGIFDRGEWEGTYYIAMEFLEGRDLKELVRDEGPLAPERAAGIAIQILKALRFAHRRGIVHRDIKPHNVIVDDEGRVKVTDFGIARAGASDMTETGSIMGTAQYLSPEQAQGHPVDARADLYAVGVVLYELLTGRVPFEGDSAVTVALKQVSEPPVPPSRLNPRVPPALEAVVLGALEKEPARRFPDADAFIAALHEATGAPTSVRLAPVTGAVPPVLPAPVGVPGEPEPVRERRGRRWVVLALVALALAALGVGAYLLLRPDTAPVPDVVGREARTAATILQNAGFDPRIERVTLDEVPEDEVARQDPRAGEEAEEGSAVTLVVSTGPGTAEVPRVRNRSQARAEATLRGAGFRVQVRQEASTEVREGRVIRSSPEEGTELRRRRTVTIFVSTGPAPVAVPELVGQGRAAAEQALADAGLQARVQEREDEEAEPGTVLEQDPAAGTTLEQGATVTLTVARAPRERAVPDVTGQDVNDAIDTLQAAGFRVRQRPLAVATPEEDEQVIEQNPPAGERRRRGARIFLTVGDFEPGNLDPDPNATATPEATP